MNAIISIVFVVFSLFFSSTFAEEAVQIKQLPTLCVQEAIKNGKTVCSLVVSEEIKHYPLFSKLVMLDREVKLRFDGKTFSIDIGGLQRRSEIPIITNFILHVLPVTLLGLIIVRERRSYFLSLAFIQMLFFLIPTSIYINNWILICIIGITIVTFSFFDPDTTSISRAFFIWFVVSMIISLPPWILDDNFHGWRYYGILMIYASMAVAIRHFFWKRNSVKDIVLPSDCHPGDWLLVHISPLPNLEGIFCVSFYSIF